jgi:hypothetical protein
MSEYLLISLLGNTIVIKSVLEDKNNSSLMPVLFLFIIKFVLFQYNEVHNVFDNDTLMIISFIIVMVFFQIRK